MNRYVIHSLGLLIAWSALGTLPIARADNLLANASFEQSPDTTDPTAPTAWEAWKYAGTELTRVTDVAHTGSASGRITVAAEGGEAFPLFCQRFPVRPGERYRGSIWARTEQVTSSWGPQLNFEFLDANGSRMPYVEGGQAGGGSHDWVQLTAEAYVPPGATQMLFCAFAHSAGTVWFDDAELQRTAEPDAFLGTTVAAQVHSRNVLNRDFLGFGCHGDNLLSLPFNVDRGVTDEDRVLIRTRVLAMRPKLMRLLFDYKWWEPVQGQKDLGNPALTALVDWIQFLQTINCEVLIHPWGDQFAYSDWMKPAGDPHWWQHPDSRLPVPSQREAMVHSLADFLLYLRQDRQLSNVKYVALMNEPENDFRRPTPPGEFVRLNRLLAQCLADRGLSTEIALLGPDDCTGQMSGRSLWWNQTVPDTLEVLAGFSSHTYKHRDTRLLGQWVGDRLRHASKLDPDGPTRPLLITEFGYVGLRGETFDNPENTSYEYGLFMGDFAIAVLNSGASAALNWCLFDQYYDSTHCQRYGLWQFKDHDWAPRPGFYSWSLINRFTRAHSQVAEVQISPDCEQLRAAALYSPDHHTTLLLINRYDRDILVNLTVDQMPTGRLRLYRYTPESLNKIDSAMPPATGEVNLTPNGAVSVTMPAQTFALLTDIPEGEK